MRRLDELLDDEDFIKNLRARSEIEYEVFTSELYPKLWSFVVKRRKINPQDAEDIIGESVFKIFKWLISSEDFRYINGKATTSYIFTIVANEITEYLRRKPSAIQQLSAEHDNPALIAFGDLITELKSIATEKRRVFPESEEETSPTSKKLRCLRAVYSLEEQKQDILRMRYKEEKSFQEIGDALNISEAAARQRVSRAEREARSNWEIQQVL